MTPLNVPRHCLVPGLVIIALGLWTVPVSAPISDDLETLISSEDTSPTGLPPSLGQSLDSLRTGLLASEFERHRLSGVLRSVDLSLAELEREITAENERLVPYRRSYSTQVAMLWHMTGVPHNALVAMPVSSAVIHRAFVLANALSVNLDQRMKNMTTHVSRLSGLEDAHHREESLRRDTLGLLFEIRGDIEALGDKARNILAPLQVDPSFVIETPSTLDRFVRSLAIRSGPTPPKSDIETQDIFAALADRSFEAQMSTMPLPAPGTYAPVPDRGGLLIATAPGEMVVTPSDGVVVYSGQFPGYGHILVVNHGRGYQSVLSGYAFDIVESGEWVLAGQPIAIMAPDDSGHQTLYVELRHEGVIINPLAWLTSEARIESNS